VSSMTHRNSSVLYCALCFRVVRPSSLASHEMATIRLEWIFLVWWFYVSISRVWEESNREKEIEKQMVKVNSRRDERNQPVTYKRWSNEGSNDEKTWNIMKWYSSVRNWYSQSWRYESVLCVLIFYYVKRLKRANCITLDKKM